MSFTVRDLRRGMDVFSSDDVLLGSVIHISYRASAPPEVPAAPPAADQSAGPAFSGESLGPMPTVRLGNRGPAHQQRLGRYATASGPDATRGANQPAELLVFRALVALNWATLWPRLRRYPVSLVLHVSHERIVLAATASELDRL